MVVRRAVMSAAVLALMAASGPGAAPEGIYQSLTYADTDSLESMVRLLSIDPATSMPRSRHTFRETELTGVADLLVSRLETYTGETVYRQAFEVPWVFTPGDTSWFEAENIICRVPASGPSSGVLLVTAHFDATSHRSFPGTWADNWDTAPAPGADDNATGVAAVMEAARLLAPFDLPFDVEYVLFSAEELGRLGSIHYVSLCDEACADEFIGVINADMIGFSGEGTGAAVMSDHRSGWLADLIIGHAVNTDPGLHIQLIKPGPSNWDHASFWEREPVKLPAITLAEPLMSTGTIIYPDYHTVDDTTGNVDFGQAGRIASLMNSFIASFDGSPPEISMLDSDLLIYVNDAIRLENVFRRGESISVRPRVRNTGGGAAPAGASVDLDVWLENSGGRRLIHSGQIDPAEPLRFSEAEIDLGSGEGLSGQNIVTAEITVSGMDDDAGDNTAVAYFVVEDDSGISVIENHYFNPHPVRDSFGEALFCVNVAEELNLVVEIFTIEGEMLGSGGLGPGYGISLPTGLSCHDCRSLFGIVELAPGIYLYRMVATDSYGITSSCAGKFAVER